ncbi:fused signal recognition particle receptor [Abditibacterium utsteinense]|uniref:Signal recognition particle receptor FtsY n=1 Tax=Abditibacterium utsteinense TaxID=1960156 RepID=A0A2S8SPX2_9BACT|nr:signal recognition particle-docking protein FtsY [Abditibacterium utsteinense]PQV62847.1 fused signal recognition particle receptor [Abditibacterium utsteinense]
MLKGLFQRIGGALGRRLDDDLLDELEEGLILSDVSTTTSAQLISELREGAKRGQVPNDEAARDYLKSRVVEMLGAQTATLNFNPNGLTVWLFIGVNGVGKTTSIGKMAHRLKLEGHAPLLAAADTFRAAATEQLQEWGRRAEVPVVVGQQGADPAAVVFDAISAAKSRGCDIVLVDTAGRLHNKSNLMNELGKIARIIERETKSPPDETLLVIDATTGQNGLSQARAFSETAPLSGLILTKWDGTAKGGIILTVARETGVPVKLLGVGEKADEICDFDAKEWTETMFS